MASLRTLVHGFDGGVLLDFGKGLKGQPFEKIGDSFQDPVFPRRPLSCDEENPFSSELVDHLTNFLEPSPAKTNAGWHVEVPALHSIPFLVFREQEVLSLLSSGLQGLL